MAWLEAHDELLNHPKTAVLSASMGWTKFESVGRLMAFWWWALKYAPTGDLRKFNDAALGSAVELNGEDARRWVKAMIEACWLDRCEDTFRIHDWPDYTRRFLKDSRFRDRPDQWQKVLEVYKDAGALTGSDQASGTPKPLMSHSRVTRPTNHTEPNPPHPQSPRARRGVSGSVAGKEERARQQALEILHEHRNQAAAREVG
jgi:hypothetical protein